MIDSASNILAAFFAGVGACFWQYPAGTLVGIAIAMIVTMMLATLRKMA
jgi:uncharacterized membrane protein AbrB (regulator of aidB expression)